MNVGQVRGKLLSHGYSKSAKKNTPYVYMHWQVGEETIDSETYITPGSANVSRKALKVIGFDMDAPDADLEIFNNEPQKYAGAEANLTIEEDTYNDQVRLKVSWINAIRSVPTREESDKALAMLRAAGSEKSKKRSASLGVQKPSGIKGQVADEDIPF